MLVLMSAGHGSFPPIDCVPDNVNGARFIRDLYETSNDTSGTAALVSGRSAVWCPVGSASRSLSVSLFPCFCTMLEAAMDCLVA